MKSLVSDRGWSHLPSKPSNLSRSILPIAAIACGLAIFVGLLIWSNGSDRRKDAWLITLDLAHIKALADRADADSLVHIVAAEKFAFVGKGDLALEQANKALNLLPEGDNGETAIRVKLAWTVIAAEFGDDSAASKSAEALRKIVPQDPRLLLAEGEIKSREREDDQGFLLLVKAANALLQSADAWRRAGRAAITSQQFPEAEEAYTRAVKLAPNDAGLRASYADSLGKVGKFEEAYQQSLIAAKLDPLTPRFTALPAFGRAMGARTTQDYEAAVEVVQQTMKAQPNNHKLEAILAGLHYRFNHVAIARDIQISYLKKARLDYSGWLDLENMCQRLGDKAGEADARAHFQALVDIDDATHSLAIQTRLHPDDPKLFVQLSTVLHKAGKLSLAFEALQTAARLAPQDKKIAEMVATVQRIRGTASGETVLDSTERGLAPK